MVSKVKRLQKLKLHGETLTYGELAPSRPARGRSVRSGDANGSNPISVIVPCHRLIGADGTLVGYGGRLERKRLLPELGAAPSVD